MSGRQIDLVRGIGADQVEAFEKIREEILKDRFGSPGSTNAAFDAAFNVVRGVEGVGSLPGREGHEMWLQTEAIILAQMRPAYFIVNDRIVVDDAPVAVDATLLTELQNNQATLEEVAQSVGRVNLFNHFTHEYAGTGWLIDDTIAVTNRHVARVFARKTSLGDFRFDKGAFGRDIEARLDYVEQHETTSIQSRVDVLDVLYIAEDSQPDIAFLRVENRNGLTPLVLSESPVDPGTPVAAIGYPASDGGRNDPQLMDELFDSTYEVKRFSPGFVAQRDPQGVLILSDYTSLGGNSGSPVVNLGDGKAVGLHFAGAFRDANYAVAANVVAAARNRLASAVFIDVAAQPLEEDPVSASDGFDGRLGYDTEFLGGGALAVPLPEPGDWSADVAPVKGDPNGVLKYTHFSTVQSISRRLPLYTAVNIDGERAFRLKRKGTWKTDGRIAADHQVGNVLYKFNPLDRGHMVRRKDPGWGDSKDEAQQAEIDTFHYTNSVPQHKDLNQKDWVQLEDHILEASETRGFKVSVFTGPVYRDDDKTLRQQPGAEDIKIPEEFWKVVVMVNDDTGELNATGYVLSHGRMLSDLTEAAFVFGAFETFQVKIALIEQETGLSFGNLKDRDPLGATLEEGFAQVARRVEGPESLLLASH